MARPYIIITSIQAPNRVMREIGQQSAMAGYAFVVVGDARTPKNFAIEGCNFVGLESAEAQRFALAAACPTNHYARKNIGYLVAMAQRADYIVETDDDNLPLPSFWSPRQQAHAVHCLDGAGWINAYRYFTDELIWPRGLPLNFVRRDVPRLQSLPHGEANCPIQQGLADGNPDVDAIYRLLLPPPLRFRPGVALALGAPGPMVGEF